MSNSLSIIISGEMWGVGISCVAAFLMLLKKDKTPKDRCVMLLLFVCTVLMICDMIAWEFDGVPGQFNAVLLRISNFLVYFCSYFLVYLFVLYIWEMGRRDGEIPPRLFHVLWAIVVVGMILLIVGSPFDLYYYFDETNLYHRTPYYVLAQLPSFAGLVTLAFGIFYYRKRLSRYEIMTICTYLILPGIATIIQVTQYGYPMQVFSLLISSIITYIIREQENRFQLEKYSAELELARAEAERANAAKTVFLSNMSHDIRTPMNAIIGFLRIMEKKKQDPEAVGEYLDKIKKSGEYLLNIVNNVLEVARIDSGHESIDLAFTDLLDDSCKVTSLLEEELNRKKLRFTAEDHITHRYVFADMLKIREITMNLMSNAIKYTPEGGAIHMEFLELPCEREGYATYVNIITDNGIGMSREYQEHIFDSFSRERNTTESGVIGSGLGMSIVKRLVDLQGGSITVESEPGKGTTFRVTMEHRIVDKPEVYIEKQNKKNSQDVILVGKRILLAEDNDVNAEIASDVFGEKGITTERARDGVECVDMLQKAASDYYDFILMDIQMPNLNGYDATRRIRELEDPVKAGIPIFAMTANAFEEDKQRAIQVGMNGHFAKPIDVSLIMSTLASALEA